MTRLVTTNYVNLKTASFPILCVLNSKHRSSFNGYISAPDINTHTHIYIYIYMCVCVIYIYVTSVWVCVEMLTHVNMKVDVGLNNIVWVSLNQCQIYVYSIQPGVNSHGCGTPIVSQEKWSANGGVSTSMSVYGRLFKKNIVWGFAGICENGESSKPWVSILKTV